jgi:hydrogenase maturation protease
VTPRILIACVGNLFLGDDGFGVAVAGRLSAVDFPSSVRVADYGIRGLHLAYELAGGAYDLTVLVDATTRGDRPGTVYVIELDPPVAAQARPERYLDAHGMQPDVVLNLARLLAGGDLCPVLLVGCEPAVLDHCVGLSPAVEGAVGTAVRAVLDLVADCMAGNAAGAGPVARERG